MKYILVFLACFCSLAHSSDRIISDIFESSDKKYWHNLKSDDVYHGQVFADEKGKYQKAEGVYEQGSGICKNNQGEAGNILIYTGEVQCCMEMRAVGDSWVMSKIWVSGTGAGYRLCKNQLQKRICRDAYPAGSCDEILVKKGYKPQKINITKPSTLTQ